MVKNASIHDLMLAAEAAESSGLLDEAERLFDQAATLEAQRAWAGTSPVYSLGTDCIVATHACGPCETLYPEDGAPDLAAIVDALNAFGRFVEGGGSHSDLPANAGPWHAFSEYLHGPDGIALIAGSGLVHTTTAARVLSAWQAGWRPPPTPTPDSDTNAAGARPG